MKKILGFTLIELMVAVAVIGVLLAVAVPMYGVYIASAKSSTCLRLITPARLVADNIILENSGSAASIGTDVTELGLTADPKECDGGVVVNALATGAITLSGTVVTRYGDNTLSWTRRAADGVWQCASSAIAGAEGFAPETCP